MMHLALIGGGRWGKNILRTLESFPDVFVSVVAEGQSVPGTAEGILIATPSVTHAAIALPFIEKGLPIFIEKPMATSVADAQRLRKAAIISGAPVFVGHIQLYNPLFLKARELVPRIGALCGILAEGGNVMPRSDSSIFWDWLPHHLSEACEIFGSNPQSVTAWGLGKAGKYQSAVAKFSFRGVYLISVMSWCSPRVRKQLTISGEHGTILLDDVDEKKLIVYDLQGAAVYPAFDTVLPLENELRAFVASVRTRVSDRPHIEEGVAIACMIAAAEESARNAGGEAAIVY